MPKVVVLSRAGSNTLPPELAARIRERAALEFVQRDDAPTGAEARAVLRDATVLATTNVTLPRLDAALLAACGDLRHVVLYATGHEHVDLDVLERHGVTLSTLPTYATTAVAEHALGLLLTLATRTHLAHDVARGTAERRTSLRGVELGGRTLGIVGLGRIGSRLATLARGIGMEVVGTDIDPMAVAAARAAGIRTTGLESLLDGSDAVAVCASTLPGHGAILDADALQRLPTDGFVVNVGRPVLVDTGAVVDALRARRLRGYAVDDVVLDTVGHADLLAEGRVLQTSHSAWWRDEVLARGAELFGRAVLAAAEGHPVDVVTASSDRCGVA